MKTPRFLILGLGLLTTVCHAQITDPGWYNGPQRDPSTFSQPDNSQTSQLTTQPAIQQPPATIESLTPQQSPPNIAETITPDIQALADGLQDNPVKIYNYVHDHIKYVLYFGSKKGAELTLLEKSGNDFDQSALLAALLRAAGYNATYQFGWMQIPYDNPDGSHHDLHHWLQLNLSNTNWNYTSNYLFNLFWSVRGYPTIDYLSRYQSDNNYFRFQRVWVTMTIGSTNFYLDPAFKVSEPVTSLFNLASAAGLSSNGLWSAAGGTDTGNYVQSLNEANLRNTLTGYTTNLLNYVQNNYPNASVQQVLGGWQIVPATNTTLSTSLTFPTVNYTTMSVSNWTAIPTNMMSSLSIKFSAYRNFSNFIYQCWIPQLQGQRLALTFSSPSANVNYAELWQDDTMVAGGGVAGLGVDTSNVVISVTHPVGSWDFTNNVFIPNPNNFANATITNTYQEIPAGGVTNIYAILYAFEPDWGWLQERENKLDYYRSQGLADASQQVVSETLNIMGLNWMLQTEYANHLLEAQMGILPMYYHRIGRMAQEAGRGYYVDVYMELDGFISNSGADAANQARQNREFDISGFFYSALESGIIEQLQNTNLVGASTVKMLEIANTNGQPVYLGTTNNWSTGPNILGTLINYYDFNTLVQLTVLIDDGYEILLPQNGSNYVAGAGSWRGYGYESLLPNPTNWSQGFIISGGYNGGYSSSSTAIVNPSFVSQTGDNQSFAFNAASPFTINPTAADPVDMVNGTFQTEHTDLSLGGPEPHGITFSRYYNSARRFSNPVGMGYGWVHSYYIDANTIAAPRSGLGGTTPAQATPMIVATCAAASLYNDTQPDPKNWTVTALISKWGIDQLTKNGVSINLGKDTVQFVKQPNGAFSPPPNCTMKLIQTNGLYWLQQRHGNTFKFDSLGRVTNIVDQYNQFVTVSYVSNNLPQTVTDWKGRYMTFQYILGGTGGNRLSMLSDSTGRTVQYSRNPNEFYLYVDADGNYAPLPNGTYLYDTNNDILAEYNGYGQVIVSNIYDSQGHVITQYTQGDTNKSWRIFWSGWETVAQDPAGGQQTYFYDDQSRLTAFEDALGNLTQTFYDGQDHVIGTISPLNETNQYFYDGNNNLIETIDPLGFTNQFVYDNQNNLIRSADARGNPTTFGYNTQFSLTGQTNGAGDWVNYSYTTSGTLAGTLASKTDPGGTTSYSYDSTYGQLTNIAYPNGLGSEGFANNALGDVTSHADGNGNAITFQYNKRRELTNTIEPTNVVISVAYDPADNLIQTIDARNNVTSNTWSATRHLLTTTLPSVAAGTPVLTHVYDNRDWLSQTLDPYQEPTIYGNNPVGWLISQADPLQRTTTFGYDNDGHQTSITNAALEVTRQSWDARGKLIALTDGATHTSSRSYDGAGNQITLTNRNGNVWQFQFDGANRLTSTIPPSPMQPCSQTWNHQGLLSSVTDPARQPTYLYYDGKGRLTNRTDNTGTTLYGFDANDNRTSVSENGLTNAWMYDAYNRVSTYKDAYGNLIQYKYDGNGNLTNLVYPGGKNVYYTFDNDNHLTQVKDWSGRITTLTYDLAGRLTGVFRPNGTYRTLSYNVAGQLTNIWEQMPNTLPIAWCRFNWNLNPTMQWEFAAPVPHTNSPPSRMMTYNADNELATVDGSPVMEDNDGNLTYGPLTNDTFMTYTFDARNRLLNVGGVTNMYDGMNNRIGQTYGTNSISYVVNPNAKLPQVLERIKNGVTTYYIYGMGLLYQITETATSTNTLTYHYDYRGSTIALTADNGMVVDRFEYSLYGTLTYRAGTDSTPFLFNGRYGVQSDSNGLLYMLNRYYNPYICRFISPDPSGFSGGLNFYAYADLNPVSYLDPFGLGALGENFDASTLSASAVNSVPNVVINVNANANLGPFISAPGTATPTPYFDPNLPFYYSVTYPNDVAYTPSAGWQNRAMIGFTIATVLQSTLTPGEEGMVPGEIESTITGFRAVSEDELGQIVGDNYRFYSPPGSSTPTGNLGKFFYTDQSAAQQAASYFSKQEGINYSVIQAQVPASSVTRTFTGIDSGWIPGGANAFFSEYPGLYKAVITPR